MCVYISIYLYIYICMYLLPSPPTPTFCTTCWKGTDETKVCLQQKIPLGLSRSCRAAPRPGLTSEQKMLAERLQDFCKSLCVPERRPSSSQAAVILGQMKGSIPRGSNVVPFLKFPIFRSGTIVYSPQRTTLQPLGRNCILQPFRTCLVGLVSDPVRSHDSRYDHWQRPSS